MTDHQMLQFIEGSLRHGSSDELLSIVDPSTGTELTTGLSANASDVDAAVSSARAAFAGWSRTTPAERSELLLRWVDELRTRNEELIALESRNGGKAIKLAQGFDIPGVIDNVAFFAAVARNHEGKATGEYSGDHTSSIRREPIGVVGSIAPWNYPLQMAAWKILPAIAAGNTIVLKPSELTPLTTLLFGRNRRRGRHSRRGDQHRHRPWQHRRARPSRPSRREHGVVHRVHPSGPQRGRRGGRQRQARPS
jgi:betaine-aldehyde dehydrogenase